MKKVLLALEATTPAPAVLEFAHTYCPADDLLVGVFLEDLSYRSYLTFFGEEYFAFDATLLQQAEQEAAQGLEQNINYCQQFFQARQRSFKVHLGQGVPSAELNRESLFADLILISYNTFFSYVSGGAGMLRDVLSQAHCPILLVPDQHCPLQALLIAYDGKPNSVFAIRQFCLLCPELSRSLPATLLHVSGGTDTDENRTLMDEYISLHFPRVRIEERSGIPEKEIAEVAHRLAPALVIMGAFGRSALSRFFTRSTAHQLLQERALPVFVAHQ
ncbi:MAG: universal stress protein [Chitinophagales bacterium]|nr:universal stress protein [Chitinophagales bacterium]MDW8427333.1 universal stress protein [Chitinophagales bacterium]